MRQYISLKDYVYDYISEEVNRGKLLPNDKISETAICETLKVSRTPVREALIQLSSEGYLQNLPRKGFFVKGINEKQAKEIYSIIGVLDGRAACLATEFIGEDINKLKSLAEDMEDAIKSQLFEKYFDLQLEFHETYMEKCPNEQLTTLLRQVKRNFMRKIYDIPTENKVTELLKTNDEHFEIIKLFREKDRNGVEKYIREVHWLEDHARLESYTD